MAVFLHTSQHLSRNQVRRECALQPEIPAVAPLQCRRQCASPSWNETIPNGDADRAAGENDRTTAWRQSHIDSCLWTYCTTLADTMAAWPITFYATYALPLPTVRTTPR